MVSLRQIDSGTSSLQTLSVKISSEFLSYLIGDFHLGSAPEASNVQSMADPLSTSASILALVTFGAQSVGSLLAAIQEFRRYPTAIIQLKDELQALQKVLQSLETAIQDGAYDFSTLRLPIQQCGEACKDLHTALVDCTAHSNQDRRSFRDWAKLKYRGDDINAFKAMLSSYKATIAIALCDANLRNSNITITALNEYKDMIQTTSYDLEFRLEEIDTKLRALVNDVGQASRAGVSDLKQIREEKESIAQCLNICAQVSSNIDDIRPVLLENITTPPDHFLEMTSTNGTKDSFRLATATTLQNCNNQLQTASMWLRSHLTDLERQLSHPVVPLSQSPSAQERDKERLQKEFQTLQKSLAVCEEAAKQADQQRKNVFEDIHMADDGCQVLVSTVGDLIFARNVRAGARSIQLLGQMSDDSLQKLSQGRPVVPLSDESRL